MNEFYVIMNLIFTIVISTYVMNEFYKLSFF